jgi:hypothetical protein
MEQTDEGQEMEITPLLPSVENRGAPGRFVEKIFFGAQPPSGCGTVRKIHLLLPYAVFLGLSGHVFGKIFLGEALLWNLEPVAPIPEEL